jgi:hypothetical protein
LDYAKESNIAEDNVKYAVGNDGNNKPLAKDNNNDDVPIAAANNDKPLLLTTSTTIMPRAMTRMSVPGATTMTSMPMAAMMISKPRMTTMTSPLTTTMTMMSMLRRATLPRGTAMRSRLLRASFLNPMQHSYIFDS